MRSWYSSSSSERGSLFAFRVHVLLKKQTKNETMSLRARIPQSSKMLLSENHTRAETAQGGSSCWGHGGCTIKMNTFVFRSHFLLLVLWRLLVC